jgi:3-phenylpropionate/trans-cinnamate dioxygenase ferredoxin component
VTEVDVGVIGDFVDGGARQVKAGGRTLVIVRIGDDVYVLDDRCSHEEFSLAEGEVDVETCEIECAHHGAMFRLSDGEPTSLPATRPVRHYDTRVIDGRVLVQVP